MPYRDIMGTLQWGVARLANQVADLGPFKVLSNGTDMPVMTFALKDSGRYAVYDVSARMRMQGWQIPAYPLPKDAEDKHILRIVGRIGMSLDMADTLLADLAEAVDFLEEHGGSEEHRKGFTH
jgi:glutamate decarboxylase